MTIKPNGKWYILPVLILVISFVVGVVLISDALTSENQDVLEIDTTKEYVQELEDGMTISFYFDHRTVNEYNVLIDGHSFLLETETNTGSQYITIQVENTSSTDPNDGFSFTTFTNSEYLIDEYTNYVDVEIFEDGEYTFSVVSDEPFDHDLGYLYMDWFTAGLYMVIGAAVLVIGFGAAFISWLIIIILRSKSKKKINNPSVYQPRFAQSETKKEPLENPFD